MPRHVLLGFSMEDMLVSCDVVLRALRYSQKRLTRVSLVGVSLYYAFGDLEVVFVDDLVEGVSAA